MAINYEVEDNEFKEESNIMHIKKKKEKQIKRAETDLQKMLKDSPPHKSSFSNTSIAFYPKTHVSVLDPNLLSSKLNIV